MRPESVSAFGVNVESGVLYSWLAKRKLRRYLGDMDHISVRDVLSQEALEGILRRGDVEIVGDLVLSMRAEEPHGIALPEGPFIAVTLAPVWSHESGWREWIARELATLSDDLNLALLFVPCGFGEEKDIGEHEAVASMTGLLTNSQISMCMDASGNPRKLAGIYARASVTIGVRLHACIMSWAQRTPFVGVAYHPKLVGFARTVGVLDWLVPSVFPACQAPGSYGYAWGELDLREDMLCNVAMAAMQEARFDTLEKFKGLQRRMLRRILMTNSGEHSS
jgi:polysaccharide pyruvyl transferase WcaK-like protein